MTWNIYALFWWCTILIFLLAFAPGSTVHRIVDLLTSPAPYTSSTRQSVAPVSTRFRPVCASPCCRPSACRVVLLSSHTTLRLASLPRHPILVSFPRPAQLPRLLPLRGSSFIVSKSLSRVFCYSMWNRCSVNCSNQFCIKNQYIACVWWFKADET